MSSPGTDSNGPTPPERKGFGQKIFGGSSAHGGRGPGSGRPAGAPEATFAGTPGAGGYAAQHSPYQQPGQPPAQRPSPGWRAGPGGAGGFGAPGSPGGPSGPSGPTGPSGPSGPTGPNSQGPAPKRTWAMVLVALGCIGAMVLAIGGGITFLVLTSGGGEETAAPPETETVTTEPTTATETETSSPPETTEPEPLEFEVIDPVDQPDGDADEIWAILEDNPLTDGSLPTLGSCELPETPAEHSTEELQEALDAAGSCLNRIWATASSDRGLPWTSPEIEVYTWPDIPTSGCEADTFEEDYPRVCNLDHTIYWPEGYGRGAEQSDDDLVASTYLWDLSYMYMNRVSWDSSLSAYYSGLELQVDDKDQKREVWRRFNLQMQCLSAAATMQVPEQSQPSQAFRDSLTDADSWTAGDPPHSIEPASRAHWLAEGFGADGDLGACNTWSAAEDLVA